VNYAVFNRALWYKAISEARFLWICCVGLLFGFMWMFVWIASNIKTAAMGLFLKDLPESMQQLSGMPIDQAATAWGKVSLAYVDPVILFVAAVWAISRGSDTFSGEVNRGTMEMLLAQPVRRISVLWTQATVTIVGAATLALAAWMGTAVGVMTIDLESTVSPMRYVAPALNFFALTFFLAGASTLCSACDQYRWRTVGIMGGFFVAGMITKVLGRMAEKDFGWLLYCTFLGAYEPQKMARDFETAWRLSVPYDGILLSLGLACYLAATIIFCRRDVPAPV
jgi:ABC-2 type transport system permease protein